MKTQYRTKTKIAIMFLLLSVVSLTINAMQEPTALCKMCIRGTNGWLKKYCTEGVTSPIGDEKGYTGCYYMMVGDEEWCVEQLPQIPCGTAN